MQRKGQFTFIRYLVVLVFFVIIWLVGVGKFVGDMASTGVAMGQVTGVEAFTLMNFNLWILIGIILAAFIIVYRAGSGP